MEKTRTAYAVRGFKDAGTDETFEPGRHDFEEGAYGNYKAAGLVSDTPATAQAAEIEPASEEVGEDA